MKRIASITLLAFLGTTAFVAIFKNSQDITTSQVIFAKQNPTILVPAPTPTPVPTPTPTSVPTPTHPPIPTPIHPF
ncbi:MULTISPECIES: hypothetical protein [unclassified Anabaena]|uniref:hypothetical protein n=1 Tax=unclassified Anabaena TaxID=2619674 RepID=UPI001447D750|nr:MULTISPECIES: hypothetical protein [unclassified Anabaena]MTJ06235.1 hypothetical protein [Anabaena sp. UHCC 0204]MTJ54675.1 hypothetical protein [Anabaena sp. UHCC 0253]